MATTKKTAPARLSLDQFEAQSDVPARTLRKWMRAGILPGPLGSGRASYYEPGHVLRARAVQALRRQRLSLRAIRDRLAVSTAHELALLGAPEVRPNPGDVPLPPPAPSYPFAMWEIIELSDGIVMMVNPSRGPGVRRRADEIYRHYRS